MSAAMILGEGRLALSSRASSFSQKMSRFTLSPFISSRQAVKAAPGSREGVLTEIPLLIHSQSFAGGAVLM